jgi:hypothetical protein
MKPSSYSPSVKPPSKHPPVAPSQRAAWEPKLSDDPPWAGCSDPHLLSHRPAGGWRVGASCSGTIHKIWAPKQIHEGQAPNGSGITRSELARVDHGTTSVGMAATTSNPSGEKKEEKGGGVCGRDKRMEGCAHRHPHRGREDFHRTSSDGDDPERRWERVPGWEGRRCPSRPRDDTRASKRSVYQQWELMEEFAW